MALERLTQITNSGITSGITITGVNLTGVITATSANIGSGITLSGTQINVGSATTIHSSGFQIGSSSLHSTGISLNNINASGVVTATTFSGNLTGNVTGNATGLSGTPNINVATINASNATFSGNVSVAGTVTYEDVTNVDSVGLITARSGIRVNDGGVVLIGSGTSTGTASQRLQVTGGAYISGNLGIGVTNPSGLFDARGFSYMSGMQIRDSSHVAKGYVQGDSRGFLLATDGSTNIVFDVNATERARIDSNGNLGIGTTNPIAKLQVQSGYIKLENNLNGENTLYLRNINGGSSAYSVIRFSESNDVGNAGNAYIHYFNSGFTSNGFWDANSLASGTSNGNINFNVGGNNQFKVWTNSNQRFTITGSGNIGVNTVTPGVNLDVYGSDSHIRATESGSGNQWRSRIISRNIDSSVNAAAFMGIYNTSACIAAHNSSLSAWATLFVNTTNGISDGGNVILAGSGNVSIGSASPSAKLDIVGGGTAQLQVTGTEADVWLKSTGPGNTVWRILGSITNNTHRFRIYDQTNNAERFAIDSSGRVTTPSQPVFKAYRSASTSGAGVIVFNNEVYDVGNNYNNSNGLFTAPVAGYYIFFFVSIGSGVSNTFRDVWGSVNGVTTPSSFGARPTNQTTDYSSSGSATNIVYLNANDTFGLYASGTLYSDANIWLQFGGYLLG